MNQKLLYSQENYGSPSQLVLRAFADAIRCAGQFAGSTSANPPVGCVLLDEQGNKLALAAHQKAGEPHAEALAIEQCQKAGTYERIHSVIVTLEPCNHTGRTPPCTKAILGTPARKVWIGSKDPDPNVCGGGAKELASSGLTVRYIEQMGCPAAVELAQAAQRLIAPFAKRVTQGVPWVTVKQAINRAGSMIPEAGHKTFTSPESLVFAHYLRKRADAVLTGSGTVLADNPKFTVRHIADFTDKRRYLVIMDRRGRVGNSYLEAARTSGFTVLVEASFEKALRRLAQMGVLEVLVEAGPTLLDMIMETKLWDEHVIISQSIDREQKDSVLISYPSNSKLKIKKEMQHVLWNY